LINRRVYALQLKKEFAMRFFSNDLSFPGAVFFRGFLGVCLLFSAVRVSQAQTASFAALSMIRPQAISVPVLSCGATPVPGSSCCPGLTSINGFVASGGMILDNTRNRLYVADFENNRVQVFDSRTYTLLNLLSSMGSHGALNLPVDEALDAAGNLYVADLGNQAVEKFDANYNYVVSIAAGKGLSIVGVWADGPTVYFSTIQNYVYQYTDNGSGYSATATFGGPGYLNHPNEIIKVGTWLYVTDTYNNRVVKFDLTHPGSLLVPVMGCLLIPTGIRLDGAGNFIVEESNNGAYPAYVDTFSPNFSTLQRRCTFNDTWSAVADPAGNVLVSGMNSFSVTVLQACGVSTPSPVPTATATWTPVPSTPTATPLIAPVVAVNALPNISRNGQPIRFQVTLPRAALIRLSLFTPTGESVYSTQISGQAGINSLPWSLRNHSGFPVASGLYLYAVQVSGPAGSFLKTGKIVVLH
jgi:hypothetical protein